MEKIIECVPNFSEGRDEVKIAEIVKSISETGGVKVLHTDSGKAANRTVITFAGTADGVTEAAFRAVKRASEVIDMRVQHGTHPRLGATDVLPIVPLSGITLEECAVLARELAGRIFRELGIPTYCYEAAAFRQERKRLEVCRRGEYEMLARKINDPDNAPDFGPETYTETAARAGATIVGARNFLIAVNFNLNTKDRETADEIAKVVRESGRGKGHPAGRLEGCKAIGWYIEEYGIAQVSMNITDINKTPLHVAYREVCKAAIEKGVRVTGTEIIGLIPEKVLLDAGEYFCNEEGAASLRHSAEELYEKAVRCMNLDDLCPFDTEKKIIRF